MTKAILFDLDGTLLPMEQEVFVRDYLGRMTGLPGPPRLRPSEPHQGRLGGHRSHGKK